MADDLYFIPLIAQALEQSDRAAALQAAFARIRALGQEPEHQVGFAQFQRFMEQAARGAESAEPDVDASVSALVSELAMELATDAFKGTEAERDAVLDLIHARPEWRDEFDAMREDARRGHSRYSHWDFVLECEGMAPRTLSFTVDSEAVGVAGLLPGRFALRLDTGRLLWEGELTARDLLWTAAHPGEPLAMAADSGDESATPSREESLLEGEFVLRVYPCLENGVLEIARRVR
jgi:hypothetical protein